MKRFATGIPVMIWVAAAIFATAATTVAAPGIDTFGFRGTEFVLNGRPFQMIAGELHFQRIPREYWRHRLLMARAMGLNTVCTYVFWNALEPEPGRFDFSGRNDLAAFIREARAAGLWVVVRPGPYACAEWDFGGLPSWLLAIPDIKVRCRDERYLEACARYIRRLADEVRGLQIQLGGPILMLQLENEYGSYGNDRAYMAWLKEIWVKAGLEIPFYTADGATPYMLEAGSVPGAAIGLDPGTEEKHFAEAARLGRNVPVFCSELYPGWLTHWGEPWARVQTEDLLKSVSWLLENGKSFNFYVFHGGTNFGFWAGANYGDAYQPDVTSYDYDSPLDESGRPTPKYFALREILAKHAPDGAKPPAPPVIQPAVDTAEVRFAGEASVFANLPAPVRSPQPRPMEALDQSHGFLLYRTKLVGHKSGKLKLVELHDYANVYVDGAYLGTLDRRLKEDEIEIPASDPPHASLEILVEAMGRINFGPLLLDRKGITERVTLNNMTLMDWEIFRLPLDAPQLAALRFGPPDPAAPPGKFFRGTLDVAAPGDTFLDMSGWKKGVVWVNGHNLGRFWDIGPQKRLYCPAPFLKTGRNEVVVLDLHRAAPAAVRGFARAE